MRRERLAASSKMKPALPKPTRQAALTISRPELLVDGSDQQFRRLVHNLFSFLARHSSVREGHGALINLAGIEYTMLISIGHLSAEGNVSVKDVADHLHLSGAFTTVITNKLLQKRLIEKAGHPVDRRRLCLTVTARGREMLERLAPIQRQVNDVQFGCLTAREFTSLVDMIERLVKSSEQAMALQRYLSESSARPNITKLEMRPKPGRKAAAT
jgi:MarR family transcriptional regulator, organic hydroperoxide resistance regulator